MTPFFLFFIITYSSQVNGLFIVSRLVPLSILYLFYPHFKIRGRSVGTFLLFLRNVWIKRIGYFNSENSFGGGGGTCSK